MTKLSSMGRPSRMPIARAPTGAVQREELRLPSAVDILGQVWRVMVCDPWSDSGVVGDCNCKERLIRIDASLSPDVAAEVFHHELVHAMMHASGAFYGLDSEIEEKIVYALTPVLLDTYKRNGFKFAA